MSNANTARRIELLPRYALNAPNLTEEMIAALATAGLVVVWRGTFRPRPWAFERVDCGPAL